MNGSDSTNAGGARKVTRRDFLKRAATAAAALAAPVSLAATVAKRPDALPVPIDARACARALRGELGITGAPRPVDAWRLAARLLPVLRTHIRSSDQIDAAFYSRRSDGRGGLIILPGKQPTGVRARQLVACLGCALLGRPALAEVFAQEWYAG